MNRIFNIDCMEGMADTPDKYYELAIVDPPYGIGNFVQVSGNVRGEAVTWNDSIPPPEYFDELERVSKHRIIWGANYYNRFNGNGGAIVWNKRVPRESNLSVCEIASYDRLTRVDYVDITWQNINRTEETVHPCQKPVALYRWLLKNYAKAGDKILDTHGGSMSSVIACLEAGHEITCYEKDPDYFEAAKQRIETWLSQCNMFSERPEVEFNTLVSA